ncbi:MAG: helix-turn-helix domain-containing protein [Bacteroidales bacterium]
MKEFNGETYYTIKETAEYLGVSYLTARSYIKKGYLEATKFGKPYLIKKKDIDRMIEETK